MIKLYGQCARCGGNLTAQHRCPSAPKRLSPVARAAIKRVVREAVRQLRKLKTVES